MLKAPPRLLMAVYNEIEHDGRVLRAAEALADVYDITLVCLHSGREYEHPRFRSVRLRPPRMLRLRCLLLTWFCVRLILAAVAYRPRVVYAHDYFLPVAAWLASKIGRARFVYDAHELCIPERGLKQPARDYFFYRMERLVVRRADLVIAANADRARLMQEHYGLQRLPLVIRNIPPAPAPFGPKQFEDVARRYPCLRRNHRIRVVYQGDISLARGLRVFLDAVQMVSDRCELLLIGGGPDVDTIRRVAESSNSVGSVIVLGRIPHTDLSGVVATGDIGIVTYPRKGLNNWYCASNKLYEYAQAGLPMLTTDQPALRTAVEDYGIGMACSIDELKAEEIARRILLLAEQLSTYRTRLSQFCHDNQWTQEAAKLLRAVETLRKGLGALEQDMQTQDSLEA